MKLAIFMPGRTESERLPNKLLLPIDDTGVCLWELACQKLSKITEYPTYVLVNDRKLKWIAKRFGLKVIERGKKTTKVDGPLNFIYGDLEGVPETHLMFLNPCLPFLSKETIINALKTFEKEKGDYATSVKFFQNWLWNLKGERLSPINYQELSTKSTPPIFQAAHAFHIFNKEKFFIDGFMLKEHCGLILIPEFETIDVDTKSDFMYVKFLWGLKNEKT